MLRVSPLVGFAKSHRRRMALEFVASASNNGSTITIPATAAAGHIGVLADMVWSGISTTSVTPTNWTTPSGGDSGNGSHRMVVSYKILTGSDPGAAITGMNEDTERKIMGVWRFRDGRAIKSVTVIDTNVEAPAGGNPAEQTCTPLSGLQAPVLGLGFAAHEFSVNDFSTAPTWDGNLTGSSDFTRLAYIFYQNGLPAADFSVDIGDMGNHNFLGSMALRVD